MIYFTDEKNCVNVVISLEISYFFCKYRNLLRKKIILFSKKRVLKIGKWGLERGYDGFESD